MNASDRQAGSVAEVTAVEVEPLDFKRARRKGGAGRPKHVDSGTAERGGARLSVTQANPLALRRRQMGLLSRGVLVRARGDDKRKENNLDPIRSAAGGFEHFSNTKGKVCYSRMEESPGERLGEAAQVRESKGA